jgi:hypothetical protein
MTCWGSGGIVQGWKTCYTLTAEATETAKAAETGNVTETGETTEGGDDS